MKKTLLFGLMISLLMMGCAGEPGASHAASGAPEAAAPGAAEDGAEPEGGAMAAPAAFGDYETGNADLDEQVRVLLEELRDPEAPEEENLAAVYQWVCNEITYRAGTADVSGGFTEELTQQLALDGLNKRKGNCDTEAAVMAVLLQRMGYPCQILQGQFRREDGQWVEHAWVLAQVGSELLHFDPLYGRYYADDPAEYFMQPDSALEGTHRWDIEAQ